MTFTALAYVAGSYAEGPYQITIPIKGALLAAVREPYRASLGAPKGDAAIDSDAVPRIVNRLGKVILGPPHLAQSPECVTEYYLSPDNIGNPRGIEDIRTLVDRSPRLLMVTDAGMLGSETWQNGIVLDDQFVELAQSPWDERARRHTYSSADMRIHYKPFEQWAEPSYGGWGYGELVVRTDGQTHRIPVLLQSWQCT